VEGLFSTQFGLRISRSDLIAGLTTINYLRIVIWKYLLSY